MTYLLIIIYAVSLIHFAFAERVKKFVWLLSYQGLILFGILFLNFKEIKTYEIIFAITETILIKSILIPWFLNKVRKRNKLKRIHEPMVPVFYSVIMIMLILILSFVLSNNILESKMHTQFLTVAFASIIYGLYFIIIHKNIFSHVVGYLIIENGIFLLSLAVGNIMPMMINLAILLDVVMGILVLGIFVNKVGDSFQSDVVNQLAKLKD